MSEAKCIGCGNDLGPEYDPMFCCNGWECACRGLPTNPPICSQDCWDRVMKRGKYVVESVRHPESTPAANQAPDKGGV